MEEAPILLTAFLFGLVILNGFSAGTVSFLYFWRKSHDVNHRALAAALFSGVVSAGMLSGALLIEGPSEAVFGLLLIVIICGIASLPGAFLMSRKIARSGRVDTDVFS